AWAHFCQIKDSKLVTFQLGPIRLLCRIDIAQPWDITPDNLRQTERRIVLRYEQGNAWPRRSYSQDLRAKYVDIHVRRYQNYVFEFVGLQRCGSGTTPYRPAAKRLQRDPISHR